MDLAACLADTPLKVAAPPAERPVTLYLDHSASMQGFLDPEYPTRIPTDFRSVIDKLVVGLKPARAYSFGEALNEIKPDLGTIGQKAFYSDRDTRMEDALHLIAGDTALLATHVIVGDARRGGPDAANSQFTRMREVAEHWVGQGGTFAVATSMAPFKTVASDPSGCRRVTGSTANPADQTCPLYAFAFVAAGDELRMLGALASVFEHLYAWPIPPVPGQLLIAETPSRGSALTVEPAWSRSKDGAPIARTRGPAATNAAVSVSIRVNDTTSSTGRVFEKLLTGESMRLQLAALPLDGSAKGRQWLAVGDQNSIIRVNASQATTVSVVTRGKAGAKSIVRLDVIPMGEPSWLDRFDAADAKDVVRTYGIGRLFEPFRQQAASSLIPSAHVYFVVN